METASHTSTILQHGTKCVVINFKDIPESYNVRMDKCLMNIVFSNCMSDVTLFLLFTPLHIEAMKLASHISVLNQVICLFSHLHYIRTNIPHHHISVQLELVFICRIWSFNTLQTSLNPPFPRRFSKAQRLLRMGKLLNFEPSSSLIRLISRRCCALSSSRRSRSLSVVSSSCYNTAFITKSP